MLGLYPLWPGVDCHVLESDANPAKAPIPAMLLSLPRTFLATAALTAVFAAALHGATPAPEPFAFAALGCMPYARGHDSDAAFARVIAEINRHAPAFTVHLGDIMASDEKCTDELLQRRLRDFNTFATALVYTPGDNEWTDTHTEKAGGYVPTERLARIRTLFFPTERSLGQKPVPLITQRRDPQFGQFVENARWTRTGVLFATVHAVGSKNNHQSNVPGAMEEWRERDAANEAWIRASFAEARSAGAVGVALFFQADPFASDKDKPGYAEGFERFLKTIEAEAKAYGKPVLLVHADEHRYRLDAPMRFELTASPVPNVTRLETFGELNFHAVLVTVDPGSAQVFQAGPLIVAGNPLPKLPRPKAAK
jgi:hypothetical protein